MEKEEGEENDNSNTTICAKEKRKAVVDCKMTLTAKTS